MRINLPKEEIPDQLVGFHYKSLMDMHMSYEKMRVGRESSYIKYAGVFVLVTLGLMMMDNMGINSNYLFGVLFAGIGISLVLAMNMIFISAEVDFKCSRYLEEGIALEEKYQTLINCHYFRDGKAARPARYRASLFKRLFPFVFVGGLTIWAAVAFSMMIRTSLVLATGIGGIALLVGLTFLLMRVIKRGQLLAGKE